MTVAKLVISRCMEFITNVGVEVTGGVVLAALALVWRVVVAIRGRPVGAPAPPPSGVNGSATSDLAYAVAVVPWWKALAKDLLSGAFIFAGLLAALGVSAWLISLSVSMLLAALGVAYWLLSQACAAFLALIRAGTRCISSAWRGAE